MRNVVIREELKQEGVLEKVKRSQVRWRELSLGRDGSGKISKESICG